MRLVTERLILREIKKTDLNELVRNSNNKKISTGLIGVPYPYPKKEGIDWINHAIKHSKKDPREEYVLTVSLKDDKKGKMIGEVILSEVEYDHMTANLVYWISEDYQGKGYATEAVHEIIKLGFEKLKLRRIEISAFATNSASNAMAKKLGFKYEGTKRKACFCEADGKIHDDNFYSLLDTEYFAKR